MSSIWSLTLIVAVVCINDTNGKKCLKSDVELQYTECDSMGHRWLVNVPKYNQSCDATSELGIPKPARNCGEPCLSGTYLDLESQECKDCPPGTYSQGATIEINDWGHLSQVFSTSSTNNEGLNCTRENWIPKENYISATVKECDSSLSLTTSLSKEGKLLFQYQMREDSIVFTLSIISDECQSEDRERGKKDYLTFLKSTPASSWSLFSMTLKKGPNRISWYATSVTSQKGTVKIRNLKITNTVSSTQCTNCSSGFHSGKKAAVCDPCPLNQYTDLPGLELCKPCQPEKYSLPGAKSCVQRSKCSVNDYSYRWTKCDQHNQRKKIYFWIKPKLCSENVDGSVKLPVDSQISSCGPCPRGTFLNVSSQECQFCPPGTKSSTDNLNCTICAQHTRPVMNIWYDKWFHFLPYLSMQCLDKDECSLWTFDSDHLQSSVGSNPHLLQLNLRTNDKENTTMMAKSSLSFEFSLNCSGHCYLELYIKIGDNIPSPIDTWVNSSDRMEARYDLPPNSLINVMWYFFYASEGPSTLKRNDHIKIYTIKVTDVKDVGAIECQNCNPKFLASGCLQCEKGKYFSQDSRQCESCPRGYIMKNYPGKSINDCVRCGTGLVSHDGIYCFPYWIYTSKMNNVYDLSKLKGYYLLPGQRLFYTHGGGYTHVFNVTIFSDNSHTLSVCKSNASSESITEVSSPICRVTVIKDRTNNDTAYSTQAIRLAETFQKFQPSNADSFYWTEMNDSLRKNGFPGDDTGLDLHVHLSSDRKTTVCTKGRKTIVTIRCDKKVTEGRLMLPPKCPVETCDGCNFHFLLLSRYGCPHCRLEDFNTIKEECVNGKQKVHFQEPSHCIPEPGWKSTENRVCPLVTMRTAIVVIPTIIVLVFLIAIVVYCYNKNKKLQYKYMNLIGTTDDNEQIIASADSCGMDYDDDEDDIKVKTSLKPEKTFGKFNKRRRNRKDKYGMEPLNLNDSAEFEI